MKRALFFAGMLSLLIGAADIDAAEPADGEGTSMMEKANAPGVQYRFLSGDGVLHAFDGGLADIAGQTAVTPATTFHAFSVTKTFTAAALVKLAAEGKVDLDAAIADYVPYFPYAQSPTIRQTLHHMGGFPNPIPISWVHTEEEHGRFSEAAFIRKILEKNDSLAFEPGRKFAYSNVGYLLLGQVIERVSGKSYTQYVEDDLMGPLGLEEGESLAFHIPDSDSHATGYVRRWNWINFALGFFIDRSKYLGRTADGWTAFRPFYVNGNAYGGLIGNADGFSRYLQAMLNMAPPFTAETVAEQLQPGQTNDGQATEMALGWFRGELDGVTYFAHAGGGGGYYSEIRLYPGINRASVIMTNRTGISDERILDRFDREFLAAPEK